MKTFFVMFAALIGIVAVMMFIAKSESKADGKLNPSLAAVPTSASNNSERITIERFEAVRRVFEAQGARVERDPSAEDTVRIYMPMRVSMGMTELQAKQLAGMARSRLGAKAIVYVKNEDGQTLGKAAPWID